MFQAIKWTASARVEKWDNEASFEAGLPPSSVLIQNGNQLLIAGIHHLEDLLIGVGVQALDNTHCRIGVGSGTTSVTPTDTDLSAPLGERLFQIMDPGYPSRTDQVLTFKSTFGTGVAEFAWNEWAIDAGTGLGTTVVAPLINRKVAELGNKTPGRIWNITVAIEISNP